MNSIKTEDAGKAPRVRCEQRNKGVSNIFDFYFRKQNKTIQVALKGLHSKHSSLLFSHSGRSLHQLSVFSNSFSIFEIAWSHIQWILNCFVNLTMDSGCIIRTACRKAPFIMLPPLQCLYVLLDMVSRPQHVVHWEQSITCSSTST